MPRAARRQCDAHLCTPLPPPSASLNPPAHIPVSTTQMIELQQAILDDRLDALPDVAEGAAVARKPAGHK